MDVIESALHTLLEIVSYDCQFIVGLVLKALLELLILLQNVQISVRWVLLLGRGRALGYVFGFEFQVVFGSQGVRSNLLKTLVHQHRVVFAGFEADPPHLLLRQLPYLSLRVVVMSE